MIFMNLMDFMVWNYENYMQEWLCHRRIVSLQLSTAVSSYGDQEGPGGGCGLFSAGICWLFVWANMPTNDFFHFGFGLPTKIVLKLFVLMVLISDEHEVVNLVFNPLCEHLGPLPWTFSSWKYSVIFMPLNCWCFFSVIHCSDLQALNFFLNSGYNNSLAAAFA